MTRLRYRSVVRDQISLKTYYEDKTLAQNTYAPLEDVKPLDTTAIPPIWDYTNVFLNLIFVYILVEVYTVFK
jgi:hypothetical protein